jgi:hypothetical protein
MSRVTINKLQEIIAKLEKRITDLECCNSAKLSAKRAYDILNPLDCSMFSREFTKAYLDENCRLTSIMYKDDNIKK